MVLTPLRTLAVLASGACFGFGLAQANMVSPEVVLAFLNGQDFGLMLVMGSAVIVTALAYTVLPRLLQRPLLGGRFTTHPSQFTRSTVVGSALFGVGWGLSGVCPGPAIASLGVGNWPVLFALAGLMLGAYVQGRTPPR